MQIDPAKLTQVFPAGVTPVYKGVYKVEMSLMLPNAQRSWFAHWDEKIWGATAPTPEEALRLHEMGIGSNWQDKCWQGLLLEHSLSGEL